MASIDLSILFRYDILNRWIFQFDRLESERRIFMNDFSINEMLDMQKRFQNHYQDKWEKNSYEAGKNKLLWMIGEIGEVIDIVKKNGGLAACKDVELRKHLVEEMADVLMYYNDIMLCYDISADELKQAYTAKFDKNMTRW